MNLIATLISAALLLAPTPKFEDYPAERWDGTRAPVQLKLKSERQFRTRLIQASKEPPNFAGHYRAISWGCGSNCAVGAIIDLKTGKVLQSPFGAKRDGPDHWELCYSAFNDGIMQTKKDSNLLIIRCGLNWDDAKDENDPDVYYFLLDHQAFRLILHIQAPKHDSPIQ